MRQRKYFRTKNKNNLDIDSYVSCLTQQNCKDLMLCRMLTTFIITSVETFVSEA